MLEDDNFVSLREGQVESGESPIDSVLAKIHLARVYVRSVSVCVLGHLRCESVWCRRRAFSGGVNAGFRGCEFIVNLGFTSAQLLVTIKHHVSSTLDDTGLECIRETYAPHCVIFMGMMSKLDITGTFATEHSYRVIRCVPGSERTWKIDKGETGENRTGNLDRKALQILFKYKGSGPRRSWHHHL